MAIRFANYCNTFAYFRVTFGAALTDLNYLEQAIATVISLATTHFIRVGLSVTCRQFRFCTSETDMDMEQLLSDEPLEWLRSDIEDDIDRLLLAASQSYAKSLLSQSHELTGETSSAHQMSPVPYKPSRTFAAPKTEEEIRTARAKGILSKTVEDTKYCVKLWNEWKRDRQETLGDSIPDVMQLSEVSCNTGLHALCWRCERMAVNLF